MDNRPSFVFYLLSFLIFYSFFIPVKAANIQQLALSADIRDQDSIYITLSYQLKVDIEADQLLTVKALCHKRIVPENIQATIATQKVDLDFLESESLLLQGTLPISSINISDSIVHISIAYTIAPHHQQEAIIPLILIDAKPQGSAFDTFSAEIILPKTQEIFDMFPISDLNAIEKDSARIYNMNLQVIPSWVCVKYQPLGTKSFSLNFFVDLVVVGLLFVAGFVTWRRLEF